MTQTHAKIGFHLKMRSVSKYSLTLSHNADNFCKEAGQYVNGSELASIISQDEQDLVNNLLKSNKIVDNVWIGVKK